jgi:hypothetical protein
MPVDTYSDSTALFPGDSFTPRSNASELNKHRGASFGPHNSANADTTNDKIFSPNPGTANSTRNRERNSAP